MKSIINFISILLLLVVAGGSNVLAQDKVKKVETTEFSVSGVCEMCKKRIEQAALIKGVKLAEWDKNTQMLKVIYKTKHTNEEAIHKAVAKAGHNTEKVKATDESYQKLPKCCAYRDGIEVH